jgi:hypothetical protein
LPKDDERGHLHEDKAPPYSEHKIESLNELSVLMQAMDQDEGIRIRGEVEGFENGGFIFVTRSASRYCINVCDRVFDPIRKTYSVGGNDVWFYFDTFEEAWAKLATLIRNPIEAYAY